MSAPAPVISIEDNAEFLLNTDSDLNTDENISRASIYQIPTKQYKKGYQPLLTTHTQHTRYINSYGDEDILLNPNTHKSTMSIGGAQPTAMDNEDLTTPYNIHYSGIIYNL